MILNTGAYPPKPLSSFISSISFNLLTKSQSHSPNSCYSCSKKSTISSISFNPLTKSQSHSSNSCHSCSKNPFICSISFNPLISSQTSSLNPHCSCSNPPCTEPENLQCLQNFPQALQKFLNALQIFCQLGVECRGMCFYHHRPLAYK